MDALAHAEQTDPPYRVLIVEDDRAQALFAEGVLNGAGIEALVATEPDDVLATMARARPDLVLMDLHMPGINGIQLTERIRQLEDFLHTPIVFLTGDPDPERQFEALECGADDFLQKPIRPRHLIAAVESRVRRARLLSRERSTRQSVLHATTGLMTRSHMMERLAESVRAAQGGAFFLEIERAASLRDHYGYATMEQLMTDAGRQLGNLIGGGFAARLNDNAFLVLQPGMDDAQLEAHARALRDGLGMHPFDLQGEVVRLRAAVGYTTLAHAFADAGAALEAAERAAREPRATPIGLAAYEAPQAPEGDLAAQVRAAVEQGRLEMQFQPIVAVAGGDEAQYQTLLRLRDTDGTLHSAAAILPTAEAAGLIHEIDRWVLTQALDVLHMRRQASRPVRLFVPQSPRTLSREGQAAWLAAAIAERGLDGPSLVIDLRLSDALVHAVTLRQFCDALVPVGVQFCLSQYEAGADADVLLGQLPLGYVRLSQRYAAVTGNGDLRDEMRMVVDRAHRLGLQVIGHHIEDPQAAATLWMGGIDFIQGNLVHRAGEDLDFDFKNAVL